MRIALRAKLLSLSFLFALGAKAENPAPTAPKTVGDFVGPTPNPADLTRPEYDARKQVLENHFKDGKLPEGAQFRIMTQADPYGYVKVAFEQNGKIYLYTYNHEDGSLKNVAVRDSASSPATPTVVANTAPAQMPPTIGSDIHYTSQKLSKASCSSQYSEAVCRCRENALEFGLDLESCNEDGNEAASEFVAVSRHQ